MDFVKLVNVFQVFIFVGTVALISKESNAQTTRDLTGDQHSSDSSYSFYQQSEYPRDCKEVQDQCSSANSSGVHYIKPEGYPEPFEVHCDYTADSSGWTVIQYREMGGLIDFNRTWDSYKRGFGFLSHAFWLGNEKLAYLTNQKRYQLQIEMTTLNGSAMTVAYNHFRIGDEFSNYKLISISEYSDSGVDDISWCPENLFYVDCTCGSRTCEAPMTCINTCGDGQPENCGPCPEGFYTKGQDCVPQTECGCYVEEDRTVIAEGDFFINPVNRCYCDHGYAENGTFCRLSGSVSDCQDLYDVGFRDNGIYTIKPTNWPDSAFDVYCNMTDAGGWTVFQRRVDGTVDFYLDWSDYKSGFGNLSHEFWLGNDKLSYLTNQAEYQLRIDFVNVAGAPYYAKYTSFRVTNEADNYRLSVVGTYSGTAGGDALAYHRGKAFTTHDDDNDAYSNNCAVGNHGAWWYNGCDHSDLNSDYFAASGSDYSIEWDDLPGGNFNLKYTEMKIRPV